MSLSFKSIQSLVLPMIRIFFILAIFCLMVSAQTLSPDTKYVVGVTVDSIGVAHYAYFQNSPSNVLTFSATDSSMQCVPMGSLTGQIPVVPIPMAAIPSVKTILDQITSNGTPAAFKDVSFFATSAQGMLAATALQSQSQVDWNATLSPAAILNKPSLAAIATSGAYSDLSGKPALGTAAAQNIGAFDAAGAAATTQAFAIQRANHTGTQAPDTITGLATVATTGAYGDLSGKPTLGTAASQSSSAFATSAQGTKADSALQSYTEMDPVAGAALVTHAALTTAAHGGIATSAQGTKADTAVQPVRAIATTAPLAGGGDLSADRTLTIGAATQSAAGSLSAADKTKLDGISSWTFGSPINATRTIQTVAAAANGWQLSSTRNATVSYSTALTTTTTIGGPSDGSVVLEVCSTNSPTAGNWITINTARASQTATLAIVLQLSSVNASTVVGIVPAGYYVRLRSITTAGTFSAAYVSGQEVLQ